MYSTGVGADLGRVNSFASAMEPTGRYYQNPFYELPTYALPFQDGSPLNRGMTGASRRGPSMARRNAPNSRTAKANFVAHNPFKANPGKARSQVPEDLTFDNIAATSAEAPDSVYPPGEAYLHPPAAPYAVTSPIQRPYQQQAAPPSQGYVQPAYQYSQSHGMTQQPYVRYPQGQTPLSAHPSTQQEQIPQTRPISPPSQPQLGSPFQGPYTHLQPSTNQEYGQPTGSQGTVQHNAPAAQAASTYPPSRPQGQESTLSPPRPTGYAPTQNITSPASPSLAATRPNQMSFGF